VYGLYNDEMIGVMGAGSHFGNDLIEYSNHLDIIEQLSAQSSQLKMQDPTDNFENKSLVHLVAHSFTVIGYLS
jgi:hypothetical protein